VRWAVPFVFGAGMALGHEPWIGGWPILVGLILAFASLPDSRRGAAVHMWCVGLGYFGVTLRWIVEPFLVDIVRHGWMAPFAILLMAGGLALFWGLAGWLSRVIAGSKLQALMWCAVLLTGSELLRGHVFTGFPWGLMSYALVGSMWDVWLAWVGPYGLTGLIALTAGITAVCLSRGGTLIWTALGGTALATGLMTGLMTGLLVWLTPQTPQALEATVRVVQPNAPQHLKWDRDWMGVFFNRALDLTASADPADVVIWPETSVPSLLTYAGPLFEQMALAARGAPVVAGIQREAAGDYFNSAIVLEGPATVADLYDKAHLVPFGEYIPFANVLRPLGLGTLVDQVAGFTAGIREAGGLLAVEGLGRVRVLICYEGIFPEEITTGSERADAMLILTNDAWFGQGTGPRQHLIQAQARAIEQGLPVIRSANTGISAVIDARGRIVDSLPLNAAGYLDVAVPAALPPTLYARMGDWPLAILLIGLGVAGAARVAWRTRFDVDASGYGA